MNNKLIFRKDDGSIVFHPAYLINKIMIEENKSIKETALLLGLTENEIENLINARIDLTDEMIDKIVKNYGTSKELWVNFRNKYNEVTIKNHNFTTDINNLNIAGN